MMAAALAFTRASYSHYTRLEIKSQIVKRLKGRFFLSKIGIKEKERTAIEINQKKVKLS